jgi:hypothetical protein
MAMGWSIIHFDVGSRRQLAPAGCNSDDNPVDH